MPSETSTLLGSAPAPINRDRKIPSRVLIVCSILGFVLALQAFNRSSFSNSQLLDSSKVPLLRSSHYEPEKVADPVKRCSFVQNQFAARDAGTPPKKLIKTYKAQAKDFNVFFRATAHLFWTDFVQGGYDQVLLDTLDDHLSPKATWTWTTGDQHLSNFGAWRNRHGDVVFGVNDFDEAAIYDFQVDVLRIAVSICNHAKTNNLKDKEVDKILESLTDSYVQTIEGYIGNEDALLFELRTDTSRGLLRKFLKDVESSNSNHKQLRKFTVVHNGTREFIKGPVGVADKSSKLASVPDDVKAKVVEAFGAQHYGATMMKLGWQVPDWSDDFFTVLDVGARIGSGIGSFGVDRYYVLLKGTDNLLEEDESDGAAVILDVKFEPEGAVERVLDPNDLAWYQVMFANSAARVVEAQRRLTSYVDPFTGWIMLDDKNGVPQPFTVRQRSPWKEGFDVDALTDKKSFISFVKQVGASTATSHTRGSVAKAPGDFKHVISEILGPHRKDWGKAVRDLAKIYHNQVLLDFECINEMINSTLSDQQ